jgi:hypothetical protein
MRRTLNWIAAIAALLLAALLSAAGVGVDLLKMPLRFEPSAERPDAVNEFVARGPGYAILTTPTELRLRVQGKLASSSGLRLSLVGASPTASITGEEELAGKVNYFRGNDPTRWRTNVSTFAKVRCEQVYSGVDLVFYGNDRQLEFDWVVAPGANPKAITFAVDGAVRTRIDTGGNLRMHLDDGEICLHAPQVYQMVGGERRAIAGRFVERESKQVSPAAGQDAAGARCYGFEVAGYDSSQPLVIDPVLSYSSYLGGTAMDYGIGIAVDNGGNAYVVGFTYSPDFPTTNAVAGSLHGGPGDRDAFVVKLNATGSDFVYATYLGGSNGDEGSAIAVDNDGNAYVTGKTGSPDFPLQNPLQPQITPCCVGDAFVTKLNAAGNALVYSTYLGGSNYDEARGISVDPDRNAVVVGMTLSTDFPVMNALQPTSAGGADVFLAKLNPAGSGLVYSTYLGGDKEDSPKGVAVDSAGNAYVAGYTSSTNFPTVNAIQPRYGGGDYDAFVLKVNPIGSALVYSTFLGGSDRDNDPGNAGGIAVDGTGNAYVTGQTQSPDFPTRNAWQPNQTSRLPPTLYGRGFVSKLSPDGSDLVYSTFLPGVAYTGGIAVDQANSAYVAGSAWPFFPTVNAVQPNYGGGDSDAFLLKLDPDGQAALFATYLGGNGNEGCMGVAVGQDGSAYIVGYTSATNFPTQNAVQAAFGGAPVDGFVTRISDPDTNPPVILAAGNYDNPSVVAIDFSEAVDVATATNPANYTLDQGVRISSVSMGINSKTVRVLTSGLTNGTTYTMNVSNVLDRAPVPNLIAPGTQVTFTALGLYRGFLQEQVYQDIAGHNLSDLMNSPKFPDHPDETNHIHQFEILPFAVPTGGLKVSGYLLPPITGDYTFYLCSRGEGLLSLSRNESPENLTPIAFDPAGALQGHSRQWLHYPAAFPTNAPPNISLPVHLEAGRAYYIQALVQSYAGDVLGVAWSLPGGAVPPDRDPPIQGNYLAVLANPRGATLAIAQQPEDVTVGESQTAAFSLKATASIPGIFYQWRKNGLEIPGANAPSFITSVLTPGDGGNLFDCVLTIPGATATSRPATLTVTNDLLSPMLASVEGHLTLTNITLTFSEPIDASDATNTANYALSGGLIASNAVLLADCKTVVLTTSLQSPGSDYVVQISGIRDRSLAGNSVNAGTQASFFGWVDEEFVGPFPGWANVKRDYGAVGNGITDDTTALQQALSEVATPGHAAVLYFPTGTYRITHTLNLDSRISATLAGEDPVTTIIKWDGPAGGDMMLANAVALSRWTRLTWDGSGNAQCAVHHTQIGGTYNITGNFHTDEVLQDLAIGILGDPPNGGGDGHDIVRCHFLRCGEGIALVGFNTIDWHVWDSLFEDCSYGLRGYGANFHVYRSLFLRSTEADLYLDTAYYGIRGNTSIGSKTFVAGTAVPTTIQGNTVINSLEPTPIRPIGLGPITLLDNMIVSRADAPAGPAVEVDDNLLSAGNTFTVLRPIGAGGRSIMMEDRVVDRNSIALPPPALATFLRKANRPILEVPSGAGAGAIQQAIDTAAGMNGSRPVVHLPTGSFLVDHTLVVPAGCDLQLVGDGTGFGTSGQGTSLAWIGPPGEVLLRLEGPSRATLREFSVSLGGIAVTDCDQPNARLLLEEVYIGLCRVNLLVDRIDHADVSLQNLYHNAAAEVSVKVIGGVAQAAGQPATGRVALFGGESSVNALTYQVESGGRLLVEDCWYEGHEQTRFVRLTDSGTLTINSAQIATGDSFQSHNPDSIEVDNFRGQLSILNSLLSKTGVLVKGDGSATDLLLLGCKGDNFSSLTNGQSYLVNQSTNAHVERLMSSSTGVEIPNLGEGDPVFLRRMLSQIRTETPRRLVPLPRDVSDVRIYRVSVNSAPTGIRLTGPINSAPILDPLSDQLVTEGNTLAVTNTASDPDLPYNRLSYSLGAGAPLDAHIDPVTGVLAWTPGEADGPGVYPIEVIVTDDASPPLSDRKTLIVNVLEANLPPRLGVPEISPFQQPLTLTNLQATGLPTSLVDSGPGNYDLTGLGGGFWWFPGSLAYQTVRGDFDVRVRLESIELLGTDTGAGLMVREALASDSRLFCVFGGVAGIGLDGRPSRDGIYLRERRVRNESVIGWGPSVSDGATYPNQWVRLRRQGQTFSGYRSSDGTSWQELVRTTVTNPFPQTLFVGLAMCSGVSDRTSAVRFRQFENLVTDLVTPPDVEVREGEPLLMRMLATDPDLPPQHLLFSLGLNAPEGASIDPTTGVFTWTPSENQGPGTNILEILVTDDGSPPLSATNFFTVIVDEVNNPPLITLTCPAPSTKFVAPATIELEAEASDVDGLVNKVEFFAGTTKLGESLAGPYHLSWSNVVAGSYELTSKATDDQGGVGTSPALTVQVLASIHSAEVLADGTFRLTLAGEPNRPYVIELSGDLKQWIPWQTNLVAASGWMVVTDKANAGPSGRYYRARLLP